MIGGIQPSRKLSQLRFTPRGPPEKGQKKTKEKPMRRKNRTLALFPLLSRAARASDSPAGTAADVGPDAAPTICQPTTAQLHTAARHPAAGAQPTRARSLVESSSSL